MDTTKAKRIQKVQMKDIVKMSADEQEMYKGMVVSVFRAIPTEYGKIVGFTTSGNVIVKGLTKKVEALNPNELDVILQMFQPDHNIIFDNIEEQKDEGA